MSNKVIYLAGGCFWGVQKYINLINGVMATEVGYANGSTANPTYADVVRNNTGHAETVKVTYDPNKIALEYLLNLFYSVINPVSVNRQGNDIGTQYRTGVYYVDKADYDTIRATLDHLQKNYTESNSPIYAKKQIFDEDLLYHRYTPALFNLIAKDSNEDALNILSEKILHRK